MASQSKSCKECRPANNAPFDNDLDAVDGRRTAERRPKMDAYCHYLVPQTEKTLEVIRSEAEEFSFQRYFDKGFKKVSFERAEFIIDRYAWRAFFEQLAEDKRPAFPWANIQQKDMPVQPPSRKYQRWLAAKSGNSPSTTQELEQRQPQDQQQQGRVANMSPDANPETLRLCRELADVEARFVYLTSRVSLLESSPHAASHAPATATQQAHEALRSSHTPIAGLGNAAQDTKKLKPAAANPQTAQSMAATPAANTSSLQLQLEAKEREITELKQSNASIQRELEQTNKANQVLKRSIDNISQAKRDIEAKVKSLQEQTATAQPRKRARLDSGNDTGSSSGDGDLNAVSRLYSKLLQVTRNLRFAQRDDEVCFEQIACDLSYVLLGDRGPANIQDFLEHGQLHQWVCYYDVARSGIQCPQKGAGPCKYHTNSCLLLRVVTKDGQRQLEFYEEAEREEQWGVGAEYRKVNIN